MAVNRIFFPQEALDAWLDQERVVLDGDLMTLSPEGWSFRLNSAVRFTSEVAGGGDAGGLVGKVKTQEQLSALGGEHCAGTVIIGDDAYEVVEGFVGEPLPDQTLVAGGDSMSAATRAAVEDQGDGIDPLARLLLQNR